MSDILDIERERRLIGELKDRIVERVNAEQEITALVRAIDSLESEFQEMERACSEAFDQERARIEGDHVRALQTIAEEFDRNRHEREDAHRREVDSIHRKFEANSQASERRRDESRWMVTSYFDEAADGGPKQQFEQFKERAQRTKSNFAAELHELEQTLCATDSLLSARRQWHDPEGPPPNVLPGDLEEATASFSESAEDVRAQFDRLQRQKLARIFVGRRPFLFLVLCWLAATAALFLVKGSAARLSVPFESDVAWLALAAGLGFCVAVLVTAALYAIAVARSSRADAAIKQHAANAKAALRRWQEFVGRNLETKQKQYEQWYAAASQKRSQGLKKANDTCTRELAEWTRERDSRLKQVRERYLVQRNQLDADRDSQTQNAAESHRRRLDACAALYARDVETRRKQHFRRLDESRRALEQQWGTMSENWFASLSAFASQVDRMNEQDRIQFPEWPELAQAKKSPAENVPAAIRIGWQEVDLNQVDKAIPDDRRLVPPRTRFSIPALLPVRGVSSLLIKTDAASRGKTVDVIRAVMLRLLTAMPPGTIRFTVIDPVSLGESFSAFMHLADYDERLITGRIWTESSHIEKQLANLTEHMEDVFQTYLRNEFETIDDYNKQADEVAEPYRVLVISDFPARFTEQAARRLTSIATSGARCGVSTIIGVNAGHPLPNNFDITVLEQSSNVILAKNNRFESCAAQLRSLPLSLDEPPAPTVFNEIVREQGRLTQDVRRVEVPFQRVAPAPDRLWTADTRAGIDVPLGRAGATKLQHMRLGQGTSQHVLIAGKTGAGKSTLLHVLITNLALYYSPDELEFYLVDFKKGVEFKAYAVGALPHARVIGIESDREFGLSVLERLDGVLKERGDLFRAQAVPDLPSYRRARPDAILPRILLVIDEFHEFFVDDDRIAQQASLLLDRLVRQGRAFGIHVVLGSQTLGGAYSLARSTLGQMAVRIALQCSENDAHLILSEENTAARLLNRPGEAIYNDANGLLDGNHPFQVAWLSDDTRDNCLKQIQMLAHERAIHPPSPIVFEGNVPAEPSSNRSLARLIETAGAGSETDHGPAVHELRAWLGEAVAIKDPTEVHFGRHAGSNLLIVGQSAHSALGIMANCLIALAAQFRRPTGDETSGNADFYIFADRAANAAESAEWRRIAEVFPGRVRMIGSNGVATAMAEVSALMERRNRPGEAPATPIFLMIVNLGRIRDLRRDEDDFGFSMGSEDSPPTPSRQFGDILRNGPAMGIHTIAWCDTYNNVNRWLGTQLLRDMEMRVAFQMSSGDSSNLIDAPIAGRLGAYRALLYREGDGTMEKFRPYRIPPEKWLTWLRNRLNDGEESGPEHSPVSGVEMH